MSINTTVTKTDFPVLCAASKSPSALVAIANIVIMPEDHIIETVTKTVKNDYWKKIGLSLKEIKEVLKAYNIEFKDVSITLMKKAEGHSDTLHTRKMEKEFIAKNAKEGKTYLVIARDHTWLIHDKISVDPTWIVPNAQASRRRLNSAIEIVKN